MRRSLVPAFPFALPQLHFYIFKIQFWYILCPQMALGLYWATGCLALFIAVLALDIMGIFSRKNHFDVDGRVSSIATSHIPPTFNNLVDQTVLITGGSQGMGRGLAKLLAEKGANVVIVARNQRKLDEALKYIKVSLLLSAHDKKQC